MSQATKILILIGGCGIAIMAFLTKPTKEDFQKHLQNQMKKDGILGTIGSVFVPVVLNDSTMTCYDFLVFSLIKLNEVSRKTMFLGAFGKWTRIT